MKPVEYTAPTVDSPDHEQILEPVTSLCQDVAPDILRDFFHRMDREYFRRFDSPTIARHIHLAATLTPDHPCAMEVTETHHQHFELTIVAYDYFAEFATICGLLSAFGLNIEEGQIYTFADAPAGPSAKPGYGQGQRQRAKLRPGLSRKKIVDIFRVRPVGDASFTPEDQARFTAELRTSVS